MRPGESEQMEIKYCAYCERNWIERATAEEIGARILRHAKLYLTEQFWKSKAATDPEAAVYYFRGLLGVKGIIEDGTLPR